MVHSLIVGAIAAGTGAVLWAIRIPQLIAFLVAAAAQPLTSASQSDPGDKLDLWEKVQSSVATSKGLNCKAMITYHAEYHAFDPVLAVSSLSSCLKLGVGWIRTDVRWNKVLPDGSSPNTRAIAWYRRFLAAAQDCGLKTMVVLSTPPHAVLKSDARNRRAAWLQFVNVVVHDLGSHCDAYQVMNEPNNPEYRFFPRSDCAQAVKEASAVIRASSPAAQIAVNVSLDLWGWRKYLEDLLRDSDSAINIVGLDHYPETWTVGWGNRWQSILELAEDISHAAEGSVWSNRSLAVFETGYSTNAPLRTGKEQTSYFRNLGPEIEQLRSHGALSLFGIYELCDGNSSAGLNPEAHFGILTSDLRPKAAYETVADLVRSL